MKLIDNKLCTMILSLIIGLIFSFLTVSCGCGGGGSSSGGSVTPTVTYGNIEGYVYAPYGSEPVANRPVNTEAGNMPISGATVRAVCNSSTKTTTTNSTGYFKLWSVRSGSCGVTISLDGYYTQQFSVSVSSNSTLSTGTRYIEPSTSGSITVTANVSGGTVYIDNENTSITIPIGLSYTFDEVSPGTHKVGMVQSGYDSVTSQNITVTKNQTSTVSFTLNPSGNRAPVADAGDDDTFIAGYYYLRELVDDHNEYEQVQAKCYLTGNGTDQDNDELSYVWSQVSGPSVTIENANSATANFTPGNSGYYLFKLTVSDGYMVDEDTVTVSVQKPTGQVIFTANLAQNHTGEEVYKINADGSGLTRLTQNSTHDSYVSWKPDGSKIVYSCAPTGDFNYQICEMNPDGSGVEELTDAATGGLQPSFSPDSCKIVFIK